MWGRPFDRLLVFIGIPSSRTPWIGEVWLGNAYGELGDTGKQKELLERALIINELHYGSDHPQVEITSCSIAYACLALNQLSEAKDYVQRMYLISREYYGIRDNQLQAGNITNEWGARKMHFRFSKFSYRKAFALYKAISAINWSIGYYDA